MASGSEGLDYFALGGQEDYLCSSCLSLKMDHQRFVLLYNDTISISTTRLFCDVMLHVLPNRCCGLGVWSILPLGNKRIFPCSFGNKRMRLLTRVYGIPASQQSRYLALKIWYFRLCSVYRRQEREAENIRTADSRGWTGYIHAPCVLDLRWNGKIHFWQTTCDSLAMLPPQFLTPEISRHLPAWGPLVFWTCRTQWPEYFRSTALLSIEVGGICLKMVSEAISDPRNTTIVLGEHVATHYCQYRTRANEWSPCIRPKTHPIWTRH